MNFPAHAFSSAPRRRLPFATFLMALLAAALSGSAFAEDSPYFVTYDHHMEEPGNLEVSLSPMLGTPKAGDSSLATTLELEYGTRAWWSTAIYLDGLTTFGETPRYTGVHLENRFRLLMNEHWVNPVFYLELADVNGADKAVREVVGFDSWHDLATPAAVGVHQRKREVETKLILSRDHRGWNVSGNLIAEKELAGSEPWEFGYAAGLSRPLALAASPEACSFCAENFSAGLEIYGGLGEQHQLTLAETAHYLAPSLAWSLPRGVTLKVSPAFGLTGSSNRTLVRFAVTYEFPAFSR